MKNASQFLYFIKFIRQTLNIEETHKTYCK